MYLLLADLLMNITCEVFKQCELPSYDGYVLTKYYRETCPHCQRLAPLIDELNSKLERHGMQFNVRKVECQECDCSKDDIDAVPTVVLTKDNKELGRFKGFREYEYIVDFLHKYMGVDKKILNSKMKNISGKVIKLRERDFFSAFEGPWIILFYDKDNDVKRELIKEIADVYADKITVGEISGKDSKKIEHMYSITKYPTIIGSFNGLVVHFPGDDNLPDLMEFTDKLINPSFEELSLEKFNDLKKDLQRGDPIFIVFYTNLYLANSYLKDVAHEFKYRAKIYKSGDKELFNYANIHPVEINDGKEDNSVVLVSYRNDTFYKYPHPLSNQEELYNWIFYAHYPHVSKINNTNFQPLFHGVKPLVVLLTTEEKFVDKFEMLSVERHMGVPFANEIFAVFNMDEFRMFGELFFGKKHKVPGLIIYHPYTGKLYGENRYITDDNFHMEAHRMLRNHDASKLRVYKPMEGHKVRYMASFVVVGLIFLGGYSFFTSKKDKYIKDE